VSSTSTKPISRPLTRSQKQWVLAGVLVGLAVIAGGVYRGYPFFTQSHTSAEIRRTLGCSDGDPDAGPVCDYLVSFKDHGRSVEAVLRGANPGQVGAQSGRRSIEISFDSADPFRPQEFTDNVFNNVFVILVGLAVIAATVHYSVGRVRKQMRVEEKILARAAASVPPTDERWGARSEVILTNKRLLVFQKNWVIRWNTGKIIIETSLDDIHSVDLDSRRDESAPLLCHVDMTVTRVHGSRIVLSNTNWTVPALRPLGQRTLVELEKQREPA
jgi:hypothetical protein